MLKLLTIFTALSLTIFIQIAQATSGNLKCGIYELQGIVEKNKDGAGYLYIVNKDTHSQFKFSIPSSMQIQIAPYVDRPSSVTVKIAKKVNNFNGEFTSIDNISRRIEDPLGTLGEKSVIYKSKLECEK